MITRNVKALNEIIKAVQRECEAWYGEAYFYLGADQTSPHESRRIFEAVSRYGYNSLYEAGSDTDGLETPKTWARERSRILRDIATRLAEDGVNLEKEAV